MTVPTAPTSAAHGERQAPQPISCLVADDHRAIVKLLARALEEHGMIVVGRLCDGNEALARIEAARPHVAVLDVQMPGLDGVEVARRAAISAPETAMILYTGYGEQALLAEALDVGARGFVCKEASLDELIRAIETVAAGGAYVDGMLAATLGGLSAAAGLAQLSRREREVLRLLADGLKYAEIGKRLFLSPETVRTYTVNAMRKLNADTRTQAVAIAIRQSFIA